MAVAGVLAGSSTRLARGGEPASLEWNAPMSCPTREAVLQRLRESGGPPGVSPIDTRVTVEQTAEDRYRARVELVADHQWSERSLEASSCDAIVDALVVIVRVAAAAVPSAPPPPPSPPPSGAGPSAFAALPPPAPPVPVPDSAASAVEEDRGRGFSVHTAFAIDAGSRFDATPGFAIGAAWRGAHVRFAFDLDAFAPAPTASVPPGGTINAAGASTPTGFFPVEIVFSGEPHAWLLTASAEACASEPLRRDRVLVDACLGLALEHPHFASSGAFGLPPLGELAVEWWPLHTLGVRGSTRLLFDVPRPMPTSALVAFEPSLGVVVHLGK